MSENENTKAKILEVAGNLFLTKGYEETRISDIINGLDGLTKDLIAEADNITNFAKQIEDTAQRYAEDERSRATSAQGLNS